MITLRRLDPTGADREALVDFLCSNDFPFHVGTRLDRAEAARRVDSGAWGDEENTSFWLDHDELGTVGVIRLEDLADPTPMFDLRLANRFRGRGLGAQALRAATDHVFTTMEADRFEGCTRVDNIGMRRTFAACGWVKEAHFRRGWPVTGAESVDAVNYSILRSDWSSGCTTPVAFDDLGY
ncbi:GNAT family protein [Luteococcus peritonei]|uniref:GNAT family protein n=1 Tax=Luteococcus peritonei TaxID=88874 RepID=A0ABW4RTP0_9ACTN